MLNKIKQYWQYALEALVGILTLAFFFERSKANTNEALVAEQKTQEQVATLQKQADVNDSKLIEESDKREEIKKEATNEKSESSDTTDYLSKR
jgi:hypothetical protein